MCLKTIAIKSAKRILVWLPLLMIGASLVNFAYTIHAKTIENASNLSSLERATIERIEAVDSKHDQKCIDTREILSTNVQAIDKKLDMVLDFMKESRRR